MLEARLGRALLAKRERYRAHVRCLLRYPFQDVRYMVGSVQMCSQCNDVSALSQTEIIPLISIGASFEGKKALKKMKPTLLASFIKLILLASLFLPLAVFFGYRNQELMALLVMLGSPTTVSSYIMAKNTGNDGILTSSIIVLTTLLSSLTLTLWIFVLKSFGVL